MKTQKIRTLLLFLLLIAVTFSLTACYKISLKEKQVEGIGSTISLKLPGNLQKLDFPVPVDPLTQRYFKGSRLYGEMDSGLYIAIYTNSIDTQQMYDDLHISQGQSISQRLNDTAEAASGAVLSKINAQNVSVSQDTTTVSGKHAVVQTFTFTYEDKSMRARLIGFADGPATWIVVVACDGSKDDKVKLADEVLDSISIR
ncbi:hypothetical protein [Megasphaera sp.]|uniref:hypothetical protein n=1 Tax=Megasphaera sp. TaxID=2023260 RepID=UPI0025D5121A|nr:hypothetical protein [uncultured Megasphaera sp.]